MCTTLLVASTLVGAYGAYQQASAQKAQAEYNAAVARNNSIIAAQNEADIIDRGEVALETQRARVNQTIGSARAAIAGQGLLIDDTAGATSAMLLEDLSVAGDLDVMTLKANIDRESRRARIQGAQFEAQAGLFDLEASSISPGMSALTSVAGRMPSLLNSFPSQQTFPSSGAEGSALLS